MADSMITKQALAASIKELMEREPLSKISVGDITSNCGVNRQTFYYHFKDKYELVNWIYYTETVKLMSSFSDRAHWTDGLGALCRYMRDNKRFYINALSTPGAELLPGVPAGICPGAGPVARGGTARRKPIGEEDLEFIADFYAFAFVGLIMKWARHGMKEEPDGYILRVKEMTDASIHYALEKYKKE